MKTFFALLSLASVMVRVPAVAQVQPPTGVSIAEIISCTPKTGNSRLEIEEGLRKHLAWQKANHEKWSWFAWEILTGRDTGTFIIGTFSHTWEDFDNHDRFAAAAEADFTISVAPHLLGASKTFYVLRTDLSLSPEPIPPPKFFQLNIFDVKPEGARLFSQSIRKMNAALKQTNFISESFLSPNSAGGHSRWYFMTNGGEGPQYVLVTDRNSYTEFQPVEVSLDDVMEQVYGKEQGDSIMTEVRKTFVHVRSSLVRYREDLSYRP